MAKPIMNPHAAQPAAVWQAAHAALDLAESNEEANAAAGTSTGISIAFDAKTKDVVVTVEGPDEVEVECDAADIAACVAEEDAEEDASEDADGAATDGEDEAEVPPPPPPPSKKSRA